MQDEGDGNTGQHEPCAARRAGGAAGRREDRYRRREGAGKGGERQRGEPGERPDEEDDRDRADRRSGRDAEKIGISQRIAGDDLQARADGGKSCPGDRAEDDPRQPQLPDDVALGPAPAAGCAAEAQFAGNDAGNPVDRDPHRAEGDGYDERQDQEQRQEKAPDQEPTAPGRVREDAGKAPPRVRSELHRHGPNRWG